MQIVSQRRSKIVHTEWIKIRNYVVGICKITNVECFAWDTEQIIDRRIKKTYTYETIPMESFQPNNERTNWWTNERMNTNMLITKIQQQQIANKTMINVHISKVYFARSVFI